MMDKPLDGRLSDHYSFVSGRYIEFYRCFAEKQGSVWRSGLIEMANGVGTKPFDAEGHHCMYLVQENIMTGPVQTGRHACSVEIGDEIATKLYAEGVIQDAHLTDVDENEYRIVLTNVTVGKVVVDRLVIRPDIHAQVRVLDENGNVLND